MYNRYALGAWGARNSGVTGPTHLLGKGERSSDVMRGTDRKGPGEVRLRKPRPPTTERGLRASSAALATRPPPFWNQQTIYTFWLLRSFVQNEINLRKRGGSYSVHEPRDLPGSSCTATALGPPRTRRSHRAQREGWGPHSPSPDRDGPPPPPTSSGTAESADARGGAPAGQGHGRPFTRRKHPQ